MINFKNSYINLPEEFYEKVLPTAFSDTSLISFNDQLAKDLGINFEKISDEDLALIFSGKRLLKGSSPLAMAYAGHQFGHFVPQLGDGRAILLGEVIGEDQQAYDIQLKGAGKTKFSRRGDGRSSLGPVIREYIISEAFHHLGVPSTRALSAVLTGENVFREELLPGAVLTRVSKGHIRVGTFEYFYRKQKYDHVKTLADYSIDRFDPDLSSHPDKYFLFLERVGQRKMDLVSKWMGVGFIHGVMNTDNTSISGETIDFGPCAFMDRFKHDKVFSSIDRYGRYSYCNQGKIALWNIMNLANCFIGLVQGKGSEEDSVERLNDLLKDLETFYEKKYLEVMAKKMGIINPGREDRSLIEDFLEFLEKNELDFTQSFQKLLDFELDENSLKKRWLERIGNKEKAIEVMRSVNPVIIPRNHQVEKAIQLSLKGDFSYFKKLSEALKSPFDLGHRESGFCAAPLESEVVKYTFCGT